jgi:hypothetical protein
VVDVSDAKPRVRQNELDGAFRKGAVMLDTAKPLLLRSGNYSPVNH